MTKEEIQTIVNEYRTTAKEAWSSPKHITAALEIDKHTMFMVGLYTTSGLGVDVDLGSEGNMVFLWGLLSTHYKLGTESLKRLLEKEE